MREARIIESLRLVRCYIWCNLMLVSSFMQHTVISLNNEYFNTLDRRTKDTKEEETDHEGNSRSSICQIIK